MIVKTKCDYLIFLFAVLAFCVIGGALAVLFGAKSVFGCVGILLSGIFFAYRAYSLLGRTLIFDETGCTVCFRGKKIHTTWEQLAVKRVEPPHTFNSSGYCNGAMFFSLYPCNKCISVDPQHYVSWHVNTSFWVYFKSPDPTVAKNSSGIYEVDKEEFLTKLKEWGVQFEHIRY